MKNERKWNDKSRNDLREKLRSAIRGSLRLANCDRDQILEFCRVVYISDKCPASESDEFVAFATDELHLAAEQLTAEQATWPAETDCDRLDRVEVALRDRGILLWQVSPCCDSCTCSELSNRIDLIDTRYPGFRDRARGYAFFIDQSMPEKLSDDTHLSIYLAYGWFSPGGTDVDPEVYEKFALGIAHEVCACLRAKGFEPDWDGDFAHKICVSLDWQRRTMLS